MSKPCCAIDVHTHVVPANLPAARRPASVAHEEDDAFLASHLAPFGVLINEQMEITRIRGDIAPFLLKKDAEAFAAKNDGKVLGFEDAVKAAVSGGKT